MGVHEDLDRDGPRVPLQARVGKNRQYLFHVRRVARAANLQQFQRPQDALALIPVCGEAVQVQRLPLFGQAALDCRLQR